MPPSQPQGGVPRGVRGGVFWLLILVAVNQFGYPITQRGGLYLLLYQALYASMFAAGIYVAGDTRRHTLVLSATAVLYLIFGVWYALDPTDSWKILATYVALIPFQFTVILVLLRFIFRARHIDRDVIYAAICVYLLLGAIFVPVYGILETLWPGSFVDNAAPGLPVHWQQLVYYSYVSLTTMGYGDVLPVAWWARSAATLEAVVGVLYIAILMARLVGLYGQRSSADIDR
jgi:hypothetical protein